MNRISPSSNALQAQLTTKSGASTQSDDPEANTDCQSITVDAPIEELYRQCLRFEDLPEFVTSITRIEKIDTAGFFYASKINGEEAICRVDIVMRVSHRRIAFYSNSYKFRVGVIFFDRLLGGSTKVTVKIRSMVDSAILRETLGRYLQNFKRFAEAP